MVDRGENKRVSPGSESMASMRLLFTAYLGDLAYSRKSIFRTRSIFVQGGRNGMQGVGFAHSTKEAGNDGGGKGRTCKPFLGQNISHTGGGRRWQMRSKE
ncbi:hypothetical protein H0A61_02041 [Koleobacter methoxysyntrophicus]|uniref:Uncharacterized protein n=1 Tax=Koleobacter methoxysyntrophicus TaxID=2751313 RepID=A0A8A0RP36_9FIRM|nr:hypothetical protein [Koleobacter methoxysyntrophicus]QSQ09662.1 hypothetical protein H0A61_02041 [Koleobacter methoxysyntrophicus]